MKNNPILEKNAWIDVHGYAAGKRTLHCGRIIQSHWHNYYELEMITRGKVRHTLNKETTDIVRGAVYFLTPIDRHALVCVEETDNINIAFTDDMISPKLRHYLNQPICRSFNLAGDEFDYLESRAMRLVKENESNIFNSEIASAIITEIFYLLLRHISFEQTTDRSPNLLQSAINIINTQYLEEATINSVAQKLHVTPQYLGKLFKEEMNTSISDYVTNLRLKHACSMLVHTDQSIKSIAFESGYNSVEYFLYVFKKNIKTTPSEYRKTNQDKVL